MTDKAAILQLYLYLLLYYQQAARRMYTSCATNEFTYYADTILKIISAQERHNRKKSSIRSARQLQLSMPRARRARQVYALSYST